MLWSRAQRMWKKISSLECCCHLHGRKTTNKTWLISRHASAIGYLLWKHTLEIPKFVSLFDYPNHNWSDSIYYFDLTSYLKFLQKLEQITLFRLVGIHQLYGIRADPMKSSLPSKQSKVQLEPCDCDRLRKRMKAPNLTVW